MFVIICLKGLPWIVFIFYNIYVEGEGADWSCTRHLHRLSELEEIQQHLLYLYECICVDEVENAVLYALGS